MNSLKFLRTLPGAIAALIVVGAGSAGVYALSNWFNGDVSVKQQASVFSVDLTQCKGPLPPGVESSDRSKVQFKILGERHISATQLQRQLLVQCEFDAVVDFYHQNPATKDLSLHVGTIKVVSGSDITFEYSWGNKVKERTLALASNTTIYDQGAAITTQSLHPGDNVIFVTSTPPHVEEGADPLLSVSQVRSVFRTQYNAAEAPGVGKKGFYEDNHIMPLDWYNQIHK